MRHALLFLAVLSAAACNRKPAEPVVPPAPAPAAASDASAASSAAADATAAAASGQAANADPELAAKQAALAYAVAEDGYINDVDGQWATTAKASNWFGHDSDAAPDDRSSNVPWQASGAPNDTDWTNNSQSVGMDWLELSYARPVHATEVRVVMRDETAVDALAKIELVDDAGTRHTVWSGVSDVPATEPRTWFNKTFPATPYLATGVRLTFANAVKSGYKTVDAVQLVGKAP